MFLKLRMDRRSYFIIAGGGGGMGAGRAGVGLALKASKGFS